MKTETVKIRISVRNIVEFILRSGDIDSKSAGTDPAVAMQAGVRLHKKIQKSMGPGYTAEVPLKTAVSYEKGDVTFKLIVEGRADGIYEGETCTMVDEIKCVMRDLSYIEAPVKEHRAQAMCYAYFLLADKPEKTGKKSKKPKPEIGIRITYCNIDTEEKKYFEELFTRKELEDFFEHLTDEYIKWEETHYRWVKQRNESLKTLEFPFEYREGQHKLVGDVYRSILRKKRLFIEAPTGVGKTISTVFPAVKGLGEGLYDMLFYNTSKTTLGTVAKEAFRILSEAGAKLKVVSLTAKDKICILETPECTPAACPRAKGHFDRVNDAVYDLITSEESITRELVTAYAEKHNVCPFEMCLDVAVWADAVICDYNYVFDPNVRLKRFFADEPEEKYLLLADEAHNLVERAREMYSASLLKEDFLKVKRLVKKVDKSLVNALESCNIKLLRLKRECTEVMLLEDIDELAFSLVTLVSHLDKFMRKNREFEGHDEVLDFYFELRHFINMQEIADDKFRFVADFTEDGDFRVRIMCMDPSGVLGQILNAFRSSIFFSATLLPVNYYREQLGGREDDYAVYAPSPFPKDNRLILIGRDVTTKYTRRTDQEYKRIAAYIEEFVKAKKGNYMVFFPSYKMLESIAEHVKDRVPGFIAQKPGMKEEEREEFIETFKDETAVHTGFCVLGGIFGEGIDLKEDRLIGAAIVGTGLPQVCLERELYKDFFDERNGRGFDYSYLYAGMNKVQQAAGRVIRTMSDRGAILLLDERFLKWEYRGLFPREWEENKVVNLEGMKTELKKFWEK